MSHLVTISILSRSAGRGLQRRPKNRLGGIAAIDVGLIQGGDALRQAGLDLGLHMAGRGVRVIAQPPHAIDDAAEAAILLRFQCVPSAAHSVPSGVAGVSAGTRPYACGSEQVFSCGRTFVAEMPGLIQMRIARKDEGADAHLLIGLDLAHHLIGRADQRRAAARARPPDAGPQMRLDIAELVGQFAGRWPDARRPDDAESCARSRISLPYSSSSLETSCSAYSRASASVSRTIICTRSP